MKKLFAIILAISMILVPSAAFAAEDGAGLVISANPAAASGGITIICTNDAHCEYLQYDRVAALSKDADLLVDGGDFIQGDLVGTLSKGAYIVDIMNRLGYDAAVPGNHEFDYGMGNLNSLSERAEFDILSCNLISLKTGKTLANPYKVYEAGGKKVAFIGVTTPESYASSNPQNFKDANGNYIYGLSEGQGGAELHARVQQEIDAARKEADYVFLIAHIGVMASLSPWTAEELVAGISGIDGLIDGHSHDAYVKVLKDKNGADVPAIQTGTKLANAGRISISAGGVVKAELIDLSTVEPDPETTEFLKEITARFENLTAKEIAETSVDLTILGADGNRAVRTAETNLGDLVADAYKTVLGAEIGIINGGGVRADIPAGKITYGDIIAAQPFGNTLCLAKIKGQTLADAIEYACAGLPLEFGGFWQVSGISYSVDSSIPSPCVRDDKNQFAGINGPRRVFDIKVGGKALDPDKWYTVAGTEYTIINAGDGFAMFNSNNTEILAQGAYIDNQAVIDYITDSLGGKVGAAYRNAQGRIVYAEKPAVSEDPSAQEKPVGQLTYTVRPGDCLWSIAQRYLGGGSQWKILYERNKASIKNPNLIYVGQVLRLF